MNLTTIISGNFATSKDNKGNFTGKTATGQQVFISKALVESIGIKKNEDMKAPFYVFLETRTFDDFTNDKGETIKGFTRTQVSSIFKNEDDAISASLADDILNMKREIKKRNIWEETISASTLSDESVAILQQYSF